MSSSSRVIRIDHCGDNASLEWALQVIKEQVARHRDEWPKALHGWIEGESGQFYYSVKMKD